MKDVFFQSRLDVGQTAGDADLLVVDHRQTRDQRGDVLTVRLASALQLVDAAAQGGDLLALTDLAASASCCFEP